MSEQAPTPRDLPRGARANAVPPPDAWAWLDEVDSRVAVPLLDSLEDAGVAAYAEPYGADRRRLHADAAQLDVARAVLAAELPGMLAELGPQDDPFEAIVASWDTPNEAPVAPWPALEDVPVRPARRVEPPPEPPRPAPREEEHFVPPPPPPVPAPHPVTRRAALAIAAGLFVLVGLPLFNTQPSQALSVIAALAVVGGLGTLVWRMRDTPSVDDGPDDGAVV